MEQRADNQEPNNQEQAATEYRVLGPPGCGKTTYLTRQIDNAHARGDTVLVSSLTRAAAAEMVSRDLVIPPQHVGTLHSHCFHSLGAPQIALGKDNIGDWNERYPEFSLGQEHRSLDEENFQDLPRGLPGDILMSRYQIHRARMETHRMPDDVAAFAAAWTQWKLELGLMDFTDLIEVCLRDVPTAPDNPNVIVIDEAQDLDYLQMALIRKWGAAASSLVVVGDPDQCIYRWRGSDPSAFSTPQIPAENKRVLAQSYRVPNEVHAKAVGWISQVRDREPVEYYPRDAEGEIRTITATYTFPEPALEDAERYLAQGKQVMFLASCSYMITPLLQVLRKQGIPFHNPHSRMNGAWNPLQKRRNTISGADRILAFLKLSETGQWSAHDVQRWTGALRVDGVMLKGGRRAVKELEHDEGEEDMSWETLHQILTPEAMEAGLSGDYQWYESKLMGDKKAGAEFPLNIIRQNRIERPGAPPDLTPGVERLSNPPLLTPGTIHSTKGAETDVVYLFPDLSYSGMQEWNGPPGNQAGVYRLFYVAMTRARETLVICAPADNNMTVNL